MQEIGYKPGSVIRLSDVIVGKQNRRDQYLLETEIVYYVIYLFKIAFTREL